MYNWSKVQLQSLKYADEGNTTLSSDEKSQIREVKK